MKRRKNNSGKLLVAVLVTAAAAMIITLGLAKTGVLPSVIEKSTTESVSQSTQPVMTKPTEPQKTTENTTENVTESTTEITVPPIESTSETTVFSSAGGVMKTTADLNVRKGPGTEYEKTGVIPTGTKIVKLGEENGWVKIQYQGEIRYVSGDYLESDNGETTQAQTSESSSAPASGVTSKGYKIETINGATYVDGVLIANKSYSVPRDYGSGLTSECSSAFNKMKSAAASEGITLTIISGYRSYDTQSRLYNNYAAKDGKAKADTYSARPGTSEHQTGLAMDLNSLSTSFGETKEGRWLAQNCHKYGFIIRYPQGKQNITGYIYEPWHVRYLGTDLAQKVYQSGLCLEEYYGITSSYN